MDPLGVFLVGVLCFVVGAFVGGWIERSDADVAGAVDDSAEALDANTKQLEKVAEDYEKLHALFAPDVSPCKHCEGSGEIVKDNPLMRAVARTLDEVNKK